MQLASLLPRLLHLVSLVACSSAHQASAGQPTATGAAAQRAAAQPAVRVPQAAKGWRRRLRGGGGGGAQLLAQVVELRAQIGEPALDVYLGECSHGECSQGE